MAQTLTKIYRNANMYISLYSKGEDTKKSMEG